MKSYIQRGNVFDYIAGSTILSGAVVAVGGLVGIAAIDGDSGDTIPCNREGVFSLTKATPLAIAQGDRLFWSGTAVTKTTSDTPLGIAYNAAGSSDTTVNVLLEGNSVLAQATAIADIATADGSDAGTTQTLANATKVKINALLAALRVAGLLDT